MSDKEIKLVLSLCSSFTTERTIRAVYAKVVSEISFNYLFECMIELSNQIKGNFLPRQYQKKRSFFCWPFHGYIYFFVIHKLKKRKHFYQKSHLLGLL